jgi:protein-L-isoaspartate(D-aspartate) O-methyltransferase
MNFDQARFNMIEQQIRPWEVLDGEVLALLSVVKRENFVPAGLKAMAFVDMELPLREGGARGQMMLAPRQEARLLQDLAVQAHERVLEIGTGSGYMAALLAQRAAHVLTLEIEAELAIQARKNLAHEGISNVDVRHADGASGAPADGPFDVIVLSGSVAEVPQALLAQLSVGGRLAAIVGDEPMMRATFITRNSETAWTTTEPWDTVAPRLVSFAEHAHFKF